MKSLYQLEVPTTGPYMAGDWLWACGSRKGIVVLNVYANFVDFYDPEGKFITLLIKKIHNSFR